MLTTYTPFETRGPEADATRTCGSIAGGAALVVAGLWRGRLPGLVLALVGAAFIVRGATGRCGLDAG